MKCRMFFLMTFLLGMSVHTMAQQTTVPKYSKILELTNYVNKRKEPKTTSPRLMMRVMNGKGEYVWGETGRNHDCHPANLDVNYLWVADETAEWYHGWYGEPENMVEVYVSKKAAKVKKPLIDQTYVSECDFEAKYSVRTSGKYKGFCIISSAECTWTEYASEVKFLFIGENLDGVCIGKCFDDDTIKREGWGTLSMGANIDNLTDAQIDRLLEKAPRGTIVLLPAKYECYHPGGSYDWTSFKAYYFPDSKFPR